MKSAYEKLLGVFSFFKFPMIVYINLSLAVEKERRAV